MPTCQIYEHVDRRENYFQWIFWRNKRKQPQRNRNSVIDINKNVARPKSIAAVTSAGAAKKGGTSPVCDVLDYGEYVSTTGLNLLNTPGNDVESTTAMVGSGATLVLFTTGLGTPTGNPIAPIIKVSSNSELAQKMPDIIDIDTGAIIRGEKTIEEIQPIRISTFLFYVSTVFFAYRRR